jgi:hypothetical protein
LRTLSAHVYLPFLLHSVKLNKSGNNFYGFIFPFICLLLLWMKVKKHLLLRFLYQLCNIIANKSKWMPKSYKFYLLISKNPMCCRIFFARFGISGSKSIKDIKYHSEWERRGEVKIHCPLRVIKSRKMRLVVHVVHMEAMKNAWKSLVGRHAGKSLGRSRRRWESNTKMSHRWSVRMWNGFIWFRVMLSVCFCEHCNEHLAFTKCKKFHYQLSNY